MSSPSRVFAIIPAAGHSRRMGEPKLLLPWADATIIDHVLQAWCASRVTRVIVVIRQADQELAARCEQWPVELVRPPQDPEDMKASVQWGLRHVIANHAPQPRDAWMAAPADLPHLQAPLIDQLMDCGRVHQGVVVPCFGDRQGHPIYLPWSLAAQVFQLGPQEGLQSMLAREPIHFVNFPPESRLADVDTREDYQRMRGADRCS